MNMESIRTFKRQ